MPGTTPHGPTATAAAAPVVVSGSLALTAARVAQGWGVLVLCRLVRGPLLSLLNTLSPQDNPVLYGADA